MSKFETIAKKEAELKELERQANNLENSIINRRVWVRDMKIKNGYIPPDFENDTKKLNKDLCNLYSRIFNRRQTLKKLEASI